MTGRCEMCGRVGAVERHHIFGGAYKKKSEKYGAMIYLYVVPGELTVTITLYEYRELIKEKAAADGKLDKKDREIWELRDKLRKVEGEYNALKNTLGGICKTEENEENEE